MFGQTKHNEYMDAIDLYLKLSVWHVSSPLDFIRLYSSCVYTEYVLKPNISLYCVTKDEATFTETDKNINIYNSEESPFFYQAQFKRSINVIKMPIASFHTLAEKVGNPGIPIMCLWNTARCGSTILCQVLESVPNTLVMSEPDAPWNVYYLKHPRSVSDKVYIDRLRSTFRLLCKPQPGIERIFIKPRSPCSTVMLDI